jgi:hypothetical protein
MAAITPRVERVREPRPPKFLRFGIAANGEAGRGY